MPVEDVVVAVGARSMAVGKTTFGTIPSRSAGSSGASKRCGRAGDHVAGVADVQDQQAGAVADVGLEVGALDDAIVAGRSGYGEAVPVSGGIVSTWPTVMRLMSVISFSAASASTVVLNCAAIPDRESPAWIS